MEKTPAIGIDLGTTYSVVGVFQHGKVDIIANDTGSRTMPSQVAFNDREGILVGEAAVIQASRNPENTIFDVKRLIGRRFNEECVQEDTKNWPFTVVSIEDRPKIKVMHEGKEKLFHPEEISAMVLRKLKETAEEKIGKKVTNAVITAPAYFNNAQREATKNAGKIAGLTVKTIITEPVAGAIAYGLHTNLKDKRNVLIFDLGGGTFDVSILEMQGGAFVVKATSGDSHLGGQDFDNRMVEHFVKEIERKHKTNIADNKKAIIKLKKSCEKAKRYLSNVRESPIQIDSLLRGDDFISTITRAKFEDLNEDLFNKTLKIVQDAIKGAKIKKRDIDDIVLIGGSTRIPYIQDLLKNYFKGKELKKDINPDEAVAYGAAIRAAIENGDAYADTLDLVLVDVTPMSLGVNVIGEITNVVVKRNTPIPVSITKLYVTVEDNQTAVKCMVYEGEHKMSKDNNLLGEFTLNNLPEAPAGKIKFDVTFSLDENGILSVTAVETSTKIKGNIIITSNKGCLKNEEINRLILESEAFRKKDMDRRMRIEAKNSLETYAREMLRTSRANGDQVIIDKCKSVLTWLEENENASRAEIETQQKELELVCNEE